jgi:uncharacterized membrane protein
MKARHFWTGFAAGAATTFGGGWLLGLLGRGGHSRIIRLEKSIQIGCPLEDVFQTWSNLESLPRYTSLLRSVRRSGDSSKWVAEIGGRPVAWSAEVAQVIPNQSIGWRSIGGTHHSGRVTFSSIGDQTLVHVHMNYAPRPWFLRPLISPATGMLEGYIEHALRDLKAALESGRAPARQEPAERTRVAGTFGPSGTNPRFASPAIPSSPRRRSPSPDQGFFGPVS